MIVLKIESADSGSTIDIRIDDAEISVMNLKLEINVLTSIQPEDQILLWGVCKYKKLDSHFNINMSMLTGDERIFLFNRRVYTDEKFHPIDVKLVPYDIPDQHNHINLETSKYYDQKILDSSPLFKALPDYEEKFLMNLKKGESYLLFHELSLQSCRNALNEHYVQLDASSAAFSNLNEHFNSIERELSTTIEKCERQQLIHQKVLDNFENDLAELDKYELHPSLVQAFVSSNRSLSSSSSRLNIDPNKVNNSLLDCLSIEKEIEWFKQCQNSHLKVEESLSQLKSIFDRVMVAFKQFERITIKDITSDGINSTDDSVLLDIIKGMEDNIQLQQDSMARLREDYQFVKDKLSALFSKDPNDVVENEVVGILGTLEARRKAQEMLVKSMLRGCEQVMLNKEIMEQSKTSMNMKMVLNLRSLSKLQSEMQNGLKKRLKLLQKYVNGHNEYFKRLNNVRQLPHAYEQLLVEIARRQNFNICFDKLVTVESNRIAALRSEETKKRELFMTTFGGENLPQCFFEMIPSLQNKPPYYAPSLTEAEWLPDINPKDTGIDIVPKEDECKILDALILQDIDEMNASIKSSYLEYQNNLLMSKVAELTKKVEMLESNIEVQVKVDNTTFMDTNGSNVRSNVYVERLLRGYSIIENLLTNDWETEHDFNIAEGDELLKVFPMIANAIMKVRELKASVANISVTESDNSDLVSMNISSRNMKISFRSFDIDDIALFIPANSTCECYLAFHKNCPNHYLSEESLSQNIALSSARKPDYILGKVILIESNISSLVSNPYSLELGTTYHAITVERLML